MKNFIRPPFIKTGKKFSEVNYTIKIPRE